MPSGASDLLHVRLLRLSHVHQHNERRASFIDGRGAKKVSEADGSRSILEIAEAISVEYAAIPAEALELYFRAFEKAGMMTIQER
jgi:hypothetical protein